MSTQTASDSGVLSRLSSFSPLQPATDIVVALALVFGGGTRQGLWSDALLQLLSLLLFAFLIQRLARGERLRAPWLIAGCIIAVVCVGLYELMPVPPSVWTSLPGRGTVADAFRAAGNSLPWLPISLRPDAAWRSLIALLPPIAVFSVVLQLGFRARRRISLLFIAIGFASVLLGLAQLAQGPMSGLRFFPVTNVDSSVGFFANRNHYAALLYCLIPFVTAWITEFFADRGPGRVLGLALFLGIYLVLLLGLGMALSRAGVVLAFAATLTSLLLFLKLDGDLLKRSLTIMGATILVGAVLIGQFALFGLVARFSTDTLADARFEIARTTATASAAFAPVGSGLGSFATVYKMFEAPDSVGTTYVYHAHDDWLELWLELGVVAVALLLAFLVWIGRAAIRAWRQPVASQNVLDRSLPPAASIVVVLLLFHSIVDYPLRTTAMMTVFAVACALMVPPPKSAKAEPETAQGPAARRRTAGTGRLAPRRA